MKLNFINNYKTIYYNLNVNFYLVLNLILPIFNDVIINLQSEATKLLMNDVKTLKKIKINDFINELSECKKLLLNNEQNIYIIQYNDIQNKELNSHFICEDTGEDDTGEEDTGEEDTCEDDTCEDDTCEDDTCEDDTGDFEIKEFILKKLD
jgi:hypothetical protein